MPFLIPALVINVVIILVPAFLTLAMAFFEWDGATTPVFVGFDNFRAIFADPVFFSALLNNIKWTLIFLTIPMAMGFLGRLNAARRASRAGVFSDRLFPAGHHRDRGGRARLARHDLQSGIRDGRLAQALRVRPLRSACQRLPSRSMRSRRSTSGTGGGFSPWCSSPRSVKSTRRRSNAALMDGAELLPADAPHPAFPRSGRPSP